MKGMRAVRAGLLRDAFLEENSHRGRLGSPGVYGSVNTNVPEWTATSGYGR